MIDVKKLDKLASLKENNNYRFRSYLKDHADEKKLDSQFKRLHEKYFKIYKCENCRNCCRKIGTIIKEDELDNICAYLELDKDKFIKENLVERYGEYSFRDKSCLFLDENNNCMVEECLPEACRDYPFTDKEERLYSLAGVVANAKICPVVYEILEELKREYNFR